MCNVLWFITEMRENIVQALACFICYPKPLKALESLPQEM